jgi:hypothetical protein
VKCTFSVLLTRVIVSILLHIRLEPEVRVAIKMIRYLLSHGKKFDRPVYPALICFFKLSAVLLTEILNLLYICQVTTMINCLWSYVSLATIANLDNIYAASLKDFKLKEILEEKNLPVIISIKKRYNQDEEKIK